VVRYVGDGLIVQSAEVVQANELNGNRNFRGRFNIDIPAMKREMEEQGRADRDLVKING